MLELHVLAGLHMAMMVCVIQADSAAADCPLCSPDLGIRSVAHPSLGNLLLLLLLFVTHQFAPPDQHHPTLFFKSPSHPLHTHTHSTTTVATTCTATCTYTQGSSVTSGLRKVTPDMKAKNRADRSGHVTTAAAAAGGGAPKAPAAAVAPRGPAR